MKVFIPQLPTKRDPLTGSLVPLIDTSIAMKLGEVIICNDDMTEDFETRYLRLEERLEDGPRGYSINDVIMIAGDYALCAAAVAIAVRWQGNQTVKIATWNRETKNYDIKEI